MLLSTTRTPTGTVRITIITYKLSFVTSFAPIFLVVTFL